MINGIKIEAITLGSIGFAALATILFCSPPTTASASADKITRHTPNIDTAHSAKAPTAAETKAKTLADRVMQRMIAHCDGDTFLLGDNFVTTEFKGNSAITEVLLTRFPNDLEKLNHSFDEMVGVVYYLDAPYYRQYHFNGLNRVDPVTNFQLGPNDDAYATHVSAWMAVPKRNAAPILIAGFSLEFTGERIRVLNAAPFKSDMFYLQNDVPHFSPFSELQYGLINTLGLAKANFDGKISQWMNLHGLISQEIILHPDGWYTPSCSDLTDTATATTRFLTKKDGSSLFDLLMPSSSEWTRISNPEKIPQYFPETGPASFNALLRELDGVRASMLSALRARYGSR